MKDAAYHDAGAALNLADAFRAIVLRLRPLLEAVAAADRAETQARSSDAARLLEDAAGAARIELQRLFGAPPAG